MYKVATNTSYNTLNTHATDNSKNTSKGNDNHVNTIYNPMLIIPGLLHATEPNTMNYNPIIMTCN